MFCYLLTRAPVTSSTEDVTLGALVILTATVWPPQSLTDSAWNVVKISVASLSRLHWGSVIFADGGNCWSDSCHGTRGAKKPKPCSVCLKHLKWSPGLENMYEEPELKQWKVKTLLWQQLPCLLFMLLCAGEVPLFPALLSLPRCEMLMFCSCVPWSLMFEDLACFELLPSWNCFTQLQLAQILVSFAVWFLLAAWAGGWSLVKVWELLNILLYFSMVVISSESPKAGPRNYMKNGQCLCCFHCPVKERSG